MIKVTPEESSYRAELLGTDSFAFGRTANEAKLNLQRSIQKNGRINPPVRRNESAVGSYRATVPDCENFAVGSSAAEAKAELYRELRNNGRIKSTIPTLRKAVPMYQVAIRGFRRQATY